MKNAQKGDIDCTTLHYELSFAMSRFIKLDWINLVATGWEGGRLSGVLCGASRPIH